MATNGLRRLGRWLFSVALLTTLVVCFVAADLHQRGRLAPPDRVRTLAEFAAQMPPPRGLKLIRQPNRTSLVWIGDTARFPALPSGPACYEFDAAGRLIDFCADNGEGHRLGALCHQGRDITLSEALELIATSK